MTRDRLEAEVVALREQLQRCQSSRRIAHQRLDAFRQAFVAATPDMPIRTRAELLADLSEIRLILNGFERGGA